METIKHIIELAIERENECYLFFSQKAISSENEWMQNFFSEQAEEDLEHCEKLKTMINDKADKYDLHTIADLVNDPFLRPLVIDDDNSLVAVLELIANKKQEAAVFYHKMADIAPSYDLQSAYHNLANVELALKNRVNSKVLEIEKMNKKE